MTDHARSKSGPGVARRSFLRGGMAAADGVAATALGARAVSAATPDPLITEVQEWNQYLGDGVDAAPYGQPSEFEAHVVRRYVG